MSKCKWEQDEVCVNADCPMCADFCPVTDTPGVCKHEDRGQAEQKESICWDCINSETSVTDDFADCLCKKRGGIVGGVTECKDYRHWRMRTTKTPSVIPQEKREKCGTCRHAEPEKANGVWYVKCAQKGRYYAASGASWCGAYRPSEIEQYVAERGWERNAEEET